MTHLSAIFGAPMIAGGTMHIPVDDYRDTIDRLITEATGEVVLNGSHDHAAIILERMFSRANSCVRILTRSFDPRTYCLPETIEAAGRMLGDPSRSIKVLVDDPDAIGVHNPYVSRFGAKANFEISLVPEEWRKPIRINFALLDDLGYRFEHDDTESAAVVAFGENNLTSRLSIIFEDIWSRSVRVANV